MDTKFLEEIANQARKNHMINSFLKWGVGYLLAAIANFFLLDDFTQAVMGIPAVVVSRILLAALVMVFASFILSIKRD
jgi:hypothetical protein|uniref:Uncharacterized protein n=1 Tax=Siphoviridae sp. ctpoI7 TaxID=2825678 RepID=A0A8S5P8M7_9CAUD|nr:MAG TPA: hypothetical protein [Siphoviridae sp. ctpoI7]